MISICLHIFLRILSTVYLDASDDCNIMSFHIGSASVNGASTREWAIKITQYVCDSLNLAPDGCLQYYYGNTMGIVQTFNFEGGTHLANQNQNICIRREKNQCRICYHTTSNDDFAISMKVNPPASTMAAMVGIGISVRIIVYHYQIIYHLPITYIGILITKRNFQF